MSEDPFAKYSTIEERYRSWGHSREEARRSMERDIALSISSQLRKVIRGEGLTPEGLEHDAPIVLDLLDIQDGRVACEIIRGVLDIMTAKNVRNIQEVRNAFGGEGYPKTLKERRQRIALASGLTVSGISQREKIGLELLAREIVELVKARGRRPLDRSLVAAIDGFRRAIEERTTLLRQLRGL